MLTPAVKVHGVQAPEGFKRTTIGKSRAPVTVGCGRRGVDERCSRDGAPVEQPKRQTEVRLYDEITIANGGRRDGAKMNETVERAALEPPGKIGGRNKVGELPLLEISPLPCGAERIANGNISPSSLVEAGHKIGSD